MNASGLSDVLAAREARVARRAAIQAAHPSAVLVGVTLVLPGEDKHPLWAEAVFAEAMRAAHNAADRVGATLVWDERSTGAAGLEGLVAMTGRDAPAVKSVLVCAEDHHPRGRLWDLDVTASGVPLGRSDLGIPPRSCLVCHAPAAVCARSRAHPLSEVVAAAQRIAHTEQITQIETIEGSGS